MTISEKYALAMERVRKNRESAAGLRMVAHGLDTLADKVEREVNELLLTGKIRLDEAT